MPRGAFWPRQRGISDRALSHARRRDEGRIEGEIVAQADHIGPVAF